MRKHVVPVIFVVLGLLLIACQPQTVVIKEEVTKIVEKPIEIVKVVTATPLPAAVSETLTPGTEFPTGRFVNEDGFRAFEFDEDGTWRWYVSDMEEPRASGKYATNGDLYTEMTHNQPAAKVPATYYWAYDGKNLTFQLYGRDVSEYRRGCYNGQTYIKSD